MTLNFIFAAQCSLDLGVNIRNIQIFWRFWLSRTRAF